MSRGYGDALRAADGAAAERIALECLQKGMGVEALYGRVIAPAMWRIGCLWEEGAITVADEHLATALTHRVMASVYEASFGWAPSRPGRILLAAVEGQRHALGLRMAADVEALLGGIKGVASRASARPADPLFQSGSDSPEGLLLGAVADAADLARIHARMAHSYRRLAYEDTITRGPNRRAFDERLAFLADSPEASGVTILMLDLDGFKQVNDNFGHAAGDTALRKVFEAVESSLRDGDCRPARWRRVRLAPASHRDGRGREGCAPHPRRGQDDRRRADADGSDRPRAPARRAAPGDARGRSRPVQGQGRRGDSIGLADRD
jgi:GGDEF domain-containing protein